ncbi:nucleotidyltransferase-like protein [Mesobacillus selenatarsenatis]|uniref:CDS_ID OB0907 n=1 Tax=Mesobacillus selenatarsenatis (strain DSM 18680 / JCM 14380 / FERM P-15431 / SF-1) TaxID=1321606 RepID=A0A0A8XAE5_MESS1|nr:nucleotidyltransferase-like protein [Mesobacillus selenatarsenatis]GAM15997.1 CDS_ID OB0907 [Mesobacillus selenatarsenatis SF-1]
MEDILRSIYQERASHPNTVGVVVVEKRQKAIAATDTFDVILLIIVKENNDPVFVKHYSYEDKKAAMHIVTEKQINDWLLIGNNKKIFDWLYNGKIVFDRNERIANLKQELREFPFFGRKIKMGIEFAKLIRRYSDGKVLFDTFNYLDAYNHVVHSLHHLARLAVIENGFHPEVTVWHQVKQIEPEIYKLYEELICSEESIEKRLELLFLASEFLIHKRTKVGSQHLLEVMESKEYWSFNELMTHPELAPYSVDLGILVEYLIEKKILDVVNVETKGQGIFHRYYKSAEKLS